MKFHNVLESLLGSQTKVRIIRAFFDFPRAEFSERQMERIVGIPQASINYNMADLVNNKLLTLKRFGRTNVYSLNQIHPLCPQLKALFTHEKGLLDELASVLKAFLEQNKNILVASLFGSLLKGTERTDSDIDVFILFRGLEADIRKFLDALCCKCQDIYGNILSPLLFSEKEIKTIKTKAIYLELKKSRILIERVKW